MTPKKKRDALQVACIFTRENVSRYTTFSTIQFPPTFETLLMIFNDALLIEVPPKLQ